MRYGVNWKAYGKNFDRVFRKRRPRLTLAILNKYKALLVRDLGVTDSRGRFKKNLGETIRSVK